MSKIPTFEEQCQLGMNKRNKCQHTNCQHHRGIFYNKCWDCTTFDQAPPTPTKEITSPKIHMIRRAPEATQAEETPSHIPIDTVGKRRDVITEMPYWLQAYKKEHGLGPGQVREQPGQTWEITLPHSSALHLEGTAKEQTTPEAIIQETMPANTEEQPKRYVTVNEMFWMNPKELKRLQKDPNVEFV